MSTWPGWRWASSRTSPEAVSYRRSTRAAYVAPVHRFGVDSPAGSRQGLLARDRRTGETEPRQMLGGGVIQTCSGCLVLNAVNHPCGALPPPQPQGEPTHEAAPRPARPGHRAHRDRRRPRVRPGPRHRPLRGKAVAGLASITLVHGVPGLLVDIYVNGGAPIQDVAFTTVATVPGTPARTRWPSGPPNAPASSAPVLVPDVLPAQEPEQVRRGAPHGVRQAGAHGLRQRPVAPRRGRRPRHRAPRRRRARRSTSWSTTPRRSCPA